MKNVPLPGGHVYNNFELELALVDYLPVQTQNHAITCLLHRLAFDLCALKDQNNNFDRYSAEAYS